MIAQEGWATQLAFAGSAGYRRLAVDEPSVGATIG